MSITPTSFKEQFPAIAEHCDADGLSALLESMQVQEIKSGDRVIIDGENSDSLYLVHAGKLIAEINNDKESIRLGTIKPGDCFGEVSLLDPGPATSTVIAIEDSTLYALSHDAFRKLDKKHQAMTGNILRMLSSLLIERCRAADKLLFSKYSYIEAAQKDQNPNLIKWGLGILQELHGHKGMQP